MRDTKFGPWKADRVTYPLDGFYETQVVHRGCVVAVARSTEKEKSGKIARLIAAAPEMHEALKIAREYVAWCAKRDGWSGNDGTDLQAIDAVLAKAEANQ